MTNPLEWLTPDLFSEFAHDVGVDLRCSACQTLPKHNYIDTGSADGYVPRVSSYSTTPNGFVDMTDTRHIACVRVTCIHCGHVKTYASFAVENWRTRKKHASGGGIADLFGLGGGNGGK